MGGLFGGGSGGADAAQVAADAQKRREEEQAARVAADQLAQERTRTGRGPGILGNIYSAGAGLLDPTQKGLL